MPRVEEAVTSKLVVVAKSAKSPAFMVCSAVQVFALARLRDAITDPWVGEMVRVPSELETVKQVPLVAKQPPVKLMPEARVEVELALVWVILPPVMVSPDSEERPPLVPTLIPPAKVEVAVEDALIDWSWVRPVTLRAVVVPSPPTVNCPIVEVAMMVKLLKVAYEEDAIIELTLLFAPKVPKITSPFSLRAVVVPEPKVS